MIEAAPQEPSTAAKAKSTTARCGEKALNDIRTVTKRNELGRPYNEAQHDAGCLG